MTDNDIEPIAPSGDPDPESDPAARAGDPDPEPDLAAGAAEADPVAGAGETGAAEADPVAGAGETGAAEADPVAGGKVPAASGGTASEGTKTDVVRAQPVDVHPPTRLERTSYAVVRALFLGLAKLYFRLEIRGVDNVPVHGPFVLAPVHRSNLDFILVSTVRRQRMRYMGKASIWKFAPLGKFVSMLGAFPVHRGTADRESLRTCMDVIENGEPLVMFPEGTRRSGPVVEKLFDGPAYVAARAGVPLVPVGIGGSDLAMPVGAKFIRPRKIVIEVGAPIVPSVGDGTGRVKRREVRQMTERLQADVQRLYNAARAAAA